MKYIITLTTHAGFFFFFFENKYSSCTNFSTTKQGRLPEQDMTIPLEIHSTGSPVLYLACPVDAPCEEILLPSRAEAEQGSDGQHKAQVNQEERQEIHGEPWGGTGAALGPCSRDGAPTKH